MDDITAKIKHSPPRSLRCLLAQETGLSKSSPQTATKLMKLKSFKTTVVHEL
jgi:hypothetical protein